MDFRQCTKGLGLVGKMERQIHLVCLKISQSSKFVQFASLKMIQTKSGRADWRSVDLEWQAEMVKWPNSEIWTLKASSVNKKSSS